MSTDKNNNSDSKFHMVIMDSKLSLESRNIYHVSPKERYEHDKEHEELLIHKAKGQEPISSLPRGIKKKYIHMIEDGDDNIDILDDISND